MDGETVLGCPKAQGLEQLHEFRLFLRTVLTRPGNGEVVTVEVDA